VARESGQRLGDLLVEDGVATRSDVEAAVVEATRRGVPMARVLMERHGVDERGVFRALARRYAMVFDESETLLPRIDPEVALGIPQRFREFNRIVPICRDGEPIPMTGYTLKDREEVTTRMRDRVAALMQQLETNSP
jgi:hypothetical protein